MDPDYPKWSYFPRSDPPPDWATDLLSVVRAVGRSIDTTTRTGLTSDEVLGALRPGLIELGYVVEKSKRKADRVRRPVLFGDQGSEVVAYEIDAVHDVSGIVVEIEAGRGAMSNAVYRDLIRAALIVGTRYLVLGVMHEYRHTSGGRDATVRSYRDTRAQIDAIFASGRLRLPFEGILVFGY